VKPLMEEQDIADLERQIEAGLVNGGYMRTLIASLRASRAEMGEYRTKVSAMIDEIRAAAARADAAWEAEVAKLKRELAIADEELRQVVRERDEVAESAGKRRRR
jgi:hypothetical protein